MSYESGIGLYLCDSLGFLVWRFYCYCCHALCSLPVCSVGDSALLSSLICLNYFINSRKCSSVTVLLDGGCLLTLIRCKHSLFSSLCFIWRHCCWQQYLSVSQMSKILVNRKTKLIFTHLLCRLHALSQCRLSWPKCERVNLSMYRMQRYVFVCSS